MNKINDEIKNFVSNEINEMNKKMIRILYLCYKDIEKQEYDNCEEFNENGLLTGQKDLIYIGIFGLRDTLSNGVKNSLVGCHKAGVRVIMVTGDNLITATSIAKDYLIFPEKNDLDNLRDKDVKINPNETSIHRKKKNILKNY